MARGQDVGYYALPIIPSIQGIGPEIDRKLGKAFSGISKNASKSLSQGFADGVKAAEASIKSSSEKIAALRDKEADAAGRLRVAETRLKEVRDNAKSTDTARARAEEQHEAALRKQASSAQATGRELRNLARAQRELSDAQRNAGNSRDFGAGATNLLSGISSELGGVTGKFSGIGKGAGAAFAVGAAAAIVAGGLFSAGEAGARLVVDGFKSILETGLDFSKTVNNFQGVTRASAAEMAKFQSTARALGSDTTLAGASASSAATAMTELAKAGFSVDEAMTGARGTLELATAGQIDAAKAAEIQANAMNAFGLKADSAAHTADVLANAAIASSADIPDLGMALAQVGGVAHGFGENLDDTVAALAMFANAGVKGSDAGTLLKTTMQAITDQGNPAQGAIDALGLSLYKLNDQGQNQFVGFRELFRQLDEAKKRINDPEIFQAQTNILFGSDAMRSAMLGNQQAFDQMYTDLQRVGAGAELANTQMQGLPGAVESFKNTVESIQLDAFESLGPAVAQGLNQFVGWLGEHKSEVVSFFQTVGDAALSMGQFVGAAFFSMAKAGAAVARAFGADGVASDLDFAAEASEKFTTTLMDAQDTMEKYTRRAAEAAKLTDALGGSASNLKMVGDDVTLNIKDNTPDVQQKLAALGVHLEALANDPTTLRLVPDTPAADNAVNAWRQQQEGTPIDIGIGVHYEEGQSLLPEWFKYVGAGKPPAPMTVQIGTVGGLPVANVPGAPIPLPSFPPKLLGGLLQSFASGGVGMPKNAVIQQPVAPHGLVQWAEPGTHGEAYIPLNPANRGRSLAIWAETGRRLGAMDNGGIWVVPMGDVAGSEHGGRNPIHGLNPGQRPGPGGTTGGNVGWEPGIHGLPAEIRTPWDLSGTGKAMFPDGRKRHASDPRRGVQPLGWWSFEDGGIRGGQLPSEPGTYVITPDNIMSALQFAQSVNGNDYSFGSAGPKLFDCSGFMSAIYGIVTGRSMPDGQRFFTTESDLTKLGFVPGFDANSPFNIGVHHGGPGGGHTAGTLAGYNVEAGGAGGNVQFGGSAAGANDRQFESQYHLPGSLSSMYANGSQYGNPSGTWDAPDPKQIREAQERVDDANARVAEEEQQIREMKADAKESQKLAANNQLAKAKRERDDALADLDEAKRGKFHEGKADSGGGKGSGELDPVGGILGSFFKETFGLDGSVFPDVSQLGIVQLANAIMGIKYTPQNKGFPWQTGYANGDGTPWSGSPFGDGGAGGGTSGLPFGMIPSAAQMAGIAQPGTPLPGTPASGIGTGAPPGPVDQSRNVTVNVDSGPTPRDIGTTVRREINSVDRLHTYTPPGMG